MEALYPDYERILRDAKLRGKAVGAGPASHFM
jgi:hypothetical protein